MTPNEKDYETFAKRPLLPPATAGCQAQILTRLRRINPQNTQCMDACPDFIGVVNPPSGGSPSPPGHRPHGPEA